MIISALISVLNKYHLADYEETTQEEMLSDENAYGEYFADDFNSEDRFTSQLNKQEYGAQLLANTENTEEATL